MELTLLDTDILSEVLKGKDHRVSQLAHDYPAEHHRFAFSAITAYEIVRGMRARQATRQLPEFLKLVGTSEVFPLSVKVLIRAADLWAEARNAGHPRGDADLMIAATALESGRVLVTGNADHFSWIAGLTVANWRGP
jgi:tRNA(fMet)-specific endonuclease VapC